MKMWTIWRDGKHIYRLSAAVALSQSPSLDVYPGRIHSSAFSIHVYQCIRSDRHTQQWVWQDLVTHSIWLFSFEASTDV